LAAQVLLRQAALRKAATARPQAGIAYLQLVAVAAVGTPTPCKTDGQAAAAAAGVAIPAWQAVLAALEHLARVVPVEMALTQLGLVLAVAAVHLLSAPMERLPWAAQAELARPAASAVRQ
jgi:hypothetical protein